MLVEIWVKMGQKVTVEYIYSHSMVQKSVKNSLFFLTVSLSKVGNNGSKHNVLLGKLCRVNELAAARLIYFVQPAKHTVSNILQIPMLHTQIISIEKTK